MKTTRWLIALLGSTTLSLAVAQAPPATQPTRPQDIDPAVNTSAETLEPAVDTSAPAPSEATAPGASADPAVNTSATAAPAATAPAGPATRPRTGRGQDRLELDTTQITGNRELPKVLYIVPWKRADLGDLVGKPVNSLLDEVLAPVDRDVFKRENRYYRALQPDAGGGAATSEAQPVRPER
jgi:hypothetical protein